MPEVFTRGCYSRGGASDTGLLQQKGGIQYHQLCFQTESCGRRRMRSRGSVEGEEKLQSGPCEARDAEELVAIRNLAILKRALQSAPVKQQTSNGQIRRLCEKGHLCDALHSAELAQQEGQSVRRDDLYWLLQACSQNKNLVAARRIQLLMDSSGLYSASVLADHLIRLFTRCGSLPDAKHSFAKVQKPTVFTWNAIISAHTQLCEPSSGILYYGDMQRKCVRPNRVTFLCVLKACGSLCSLSCIRQAHNDIVSEDLDADVVLANLLIDTYAKCGSLCEARCVFDKLQSRRDVVTWTSMIAGYAQHGLGVNALDLYEEMQEKDIQPENATYSSILKACGTIGAIRQGRQIHFQISIHGLLTDAVIGGTLIDMYLKCGKVKEARLVFDSLPSCDEVSWSTMIAGYSQHGYGLRALELFGDMQRKSLKADRATYLCVLRACALVGALQEGMLVHEQLIEEHLDAEVVVRNALVDMYARCTSMEDACKVFNTLSNPDLASWGAIVSGYAMCGQGMLVDQSLRQMQRQGLRPDSMIFMSILSACSHAGLLDEGCRHFKCMIETYNVTPSVEHYNCIVDLFCRAGCLDEAQMLLSSTPTLPNVIGWTSFCSSSEVYGNNGEAHPLGHSFGG